MENKQILERLSALRDAMKENGMDYYMMTSADCHGSEYVHEHFRARAYFSGFTGSNGTLLVAKESAALWTDGRYFLQAEKQLAGTGIALMRMDEKGVPKIEEYLREKIQEGEVLGFDGNCVSAKQGEKLEKLCKEKGAGICYEKDLADIVWKERPALPANPIWELSEEYAGTSCADKLSEVRKAMEKEKADYLFLSSLDDIMWLFHLRGGDVACNPVALSYALIGRESCTLFLQKKAAKGLSLARFGVEIEEYGTLFEWLSHKFLASGCENAGKEANTLSNDGENAGKEAKTSSDIEENAGKISKKQINGEKEAKDTIKILASGESLSYRLLAVLSQKSELLLRESPTKLLKAIKNETELSHSRNAYLQDSAALFKFICWLKSHVGKEEITELSAAEKLEEFRREIPGFLDISFTTICGYAENGAIIHYSATEETNRRMEAKGMVLVDSGGQYMGGTTDVTRTIVLGEIGEEEKRMFSLVAAAMLRLSDAVFLEGTTGRNLDILARQEIWKAHMDYKHGTGHGIGYILNVHEGPQRIHWQYKQEVKEYALREGMLVSDEPGMYFAGKFGVRTENILEVVKEEENEHGTFLGFRHLTWVPIDRKALDKRFLTAEDIGRIDAYHKAVREKLMPYLDETEKVLLIKATEEL